MANLQRSSNKARARRNKNKAAAQRFRSKEGNSANRSHCGYIIDPKTGLEVCELCGKSHEEIFEGVLSADELLYFKSL